MIYSIGQQVQPRPKNKQNKYEAASELRVQNIKYDYEGLLKKRLEEWFTTDELESFRLNNLRKLLQIATTEGKIHEFMPNIMRLEGKSKQFQERMHTIMKMLVVSMGCQPLKLMSQLKEDKIRLSSLVILHNLLKETNVLLPYLESYYLAVKDQTNMLIESFVKECRNQAVNIPTFLRNYRRLHITSEQFKDFMKQIVKITSQNNEQQISKLFSLLLDDILQDRQNSTDVEYVFIICEQLHPLYSHILKQKLHGLLSKAEEIPKFRNKLYKRFEEKGYALLVNLLELSVKEWLNKDNWTVLIHNTQDKNPDEILHNFVPLIENFKEVERFYVRIMLKNMNAMWNYDIFQKILGRNYSLNIGSLKDREITKIEDNMSVVLVNKTVYPKQWKETRWENIKTSNQNIGRIIEKMQKYEKQRNSQMKNVQIVHHKITVLFDGSQKILSLEQLLSVPTTDGDYDSFYPTIMRQKQDASQPREIEQYIVEARLIKHLKRNKSDTFENICGVSMVPQERARLVLQSLIKKQYVKKDNELYVYQP